MQGARWETWRWIATTGRPVGWGRGLACPRRLGSSPPATRGFCYQIPRWISIASSFSSTTSSIIQRNRSSR